MNKALTIYLGSRAYIENWEEKLQFRATSVASLAGVKQKTLTFPFPSREYMIGLSGKNPNVYTVDTTKVAPVIDVSSSPAISWAASPDTELYYEVATSGAYSHLDRKKSLTCTDSLSYTATETGYYFVRYRFASNVVSRWSQPVEISV